MGSLFSRYRNLTVLLLVLFAQLVLVAYQVRTSQDIRLLRVWAVTAVTPLAKLAASASSTVKSIAERYFLLVGVEQENRKLRTELDRLKMENRYLRQELATAERAAALELFQARTPSKTIAARVIGTGAATNSQVLLVDRGSSAGVRPGMAVINPDGLVGKVTLVFSSASQVLLLTDTNFAAGVISADRRVSGVLRGGGRGLCRVDYVQNEEEVKPGEWFYTSGEDRRFPRGIPVGTVIVSTPGKTFRELTLSPAALARGLDEVLIVLEGVHQELPEPLQAAPLLPPVSGGQAVPEAGAPSAPPAMATDADRLAETYRKAAEATGRPYGDNIEAKKPSVSKPPAGAAKPALKPPQPGTVKP